MTSRPPVLSPRKLIEVALPLDAINVASAREKSIRHGHPSTLHLWWARRPLAAARAVLFAQLVNDPASLWELQNPGQSPGPQQRGGFTQRRKHLFQLLSELVCWENTTNEEVLDRARREIRASWREVCALNRDHPDAARLFDPDRMPGLHDPFAGGGTIPLEAQRLGLSAFASDLNPVAVLINKAMIEIPPKFAGRSPVGPIPAGEQTSATTWPGARGLAEDVRRYGLWMRGQAVDAIGPLYPKVAVTPERAAGRADLRGLEGRELTVIAWLWARTVRSPNPAFSHVDVPLVSSFLLSAKEGREAWVEPVVEGDRYRFEVRTGALPDGVAEGTKLGRGANFRCILSGTAIEPAYIKSEGLAGRMGARLMAVVAEGGARAGRVYLAPDDSDDRSATRAEPTWRPDMLIPNDPRNFWTIHYGLMRFGDLFTPRQLVALTTFSDLVAKAREQARQDAMAAGWPDDGVGLEQGGSGASAYGDAVAVYLGMAVSRFADRNNSLCSWDSGPTGTRSSTGGSARTASLRNLFARQAIPMVWDFGEANPFSDSGGGYNSAFDWLVPAIRHLPGISPASAEMIDAQHQSQPTLRFISTDPPYYDNIGYADLSDFFYVWLRRALRPVLPELFAGMAVPKAEELVATPYRHGTKEKAETFFLEGMTEALRRIANEGHPSAPVTIYYAFKQSETKGESGTSSTGWETFLEAILRAGLSVTGTWPIRTELGNRMIGSGTNALASSIVLVCRHRPEDAGSVSRREFLRELDAVLPAALEEMTKGAGEDRSPVAPVDLSQALIGPGMAVFSKYAAVLEADGTPMTVRAALRLINRFLAEDDFDADTQFCLHWFDQYGWDEGPFGEADVLARAKATSVGGLESAGVLAGQGGRVRLLRPSEYPGDWDPASDRRLPVWEALHQLVRAFRAGGETASGRLLAAMPDKTSAVRQLAYRLYTLCERRGRAEDARAYNDLVAAWSFVETAAAAVPAREKQLTLFGGGT